LEKHSPILAKVLPVICGRDMLAALQSGSELVGKVMPAVQAMVQDPTLQSLISNPPRLLSILMEIVSQKGNPRAAFTTFNSYATEIVEKMKNSEAKGFAQKVRSTFSQTSTDDASGERLLYLRRYVCVDLPIAYNRLSPTARNALLSAFQVQGVEKLLMKREYNLCNEQYVLWDRLMALDTVVAEVLRIPTSLLCGSDIERWFRRVVASVYGEQNTGSEGSTGHREEL